MKPVGYIVGKGLATKLKKEEHTTESIEVNKKR